MLQKNNWPKNFFAVFFFFFCISILDHFLVTSSKPDFSSHLLSIPVMLCMLLGIMGRSDIIIGYPLLARKGISHIVHHSLAHISRDATQQRETNSEDRRIQAEQV